MSILPAQAGALKAEREAAVASVKALQLAKEAKIREMESSLNELTRGVVLYKFLGLEFQRAENDQLLIRFTHLDPASWEREFVFRVGLGADDAYRVDGCRPELAPEHLARLLAKLNAPNEVDAMEFPGFVVEMRRAFKALV